MLFVELELEFVSRLVGSAAEVPGLSAVKYSLTVSGMSGLVLPELPSQIADMEPRISAALSVSSSGRVSVSCRNCTCGIAAELRPPRVCDLRTTEEVGSTRLTSLEWGTTGVGRISFPGRPAPMQKRTRMVGCCDLRYLTMWFLSFSTGNSLLT